MTTTTEGRKDDGGKYRHSLVPKGVLKEVIAVLMWGAKKYGDENWKTVSNFKERYYNALRRHIDAWWEDGITNDHETGQHHLAHAICCCLFLIWLDRNTIPEVKKDVTVHDVVYDQDASAASVGPWDCFSRSGSLY